MRAWGLQGLKQANIRKYFGQIRVNCYLLICFLELDKYCTPMLEEATIRL